MSPGGLIVIALLATPGGAKLPAHVGNPGGGRAALAMGIEGEAPAAAVRLGVSDEVSLSLTGVWHPDAPLVGATLTVAAGRSKGQLFAHAWVQGQLRPVITTEVQETFSGADATVGLGAVWWPGPFVISLDGGVALGLPINPFEGEIVGGKVDQRNGFFGLQRVAIALEIGDHVELSGRGTFTIPLAALELERPEEELVESWDIRFGAYLSLRW